MSLKNTLTPKEVAAIQKENLRLKQKIEILKKAITNSPKSNLHRTDWKHKEAYPIQTMCDVLAILRSTYDRFLHHIPSQRERENAELTGRIIASQKLV